jgi:hypothetical protein
MFLKLRYKNSVSTSQRTQSVSIIKINQLILIMEIGSIYRENHMKHVSPLCGKIQSLLMLRAC